MDPITILSAFIPFVMHTGKTLVNHFFGTKDGGPPPVADVGDYIKLMDAKMSMFKAINEAGGSEPTYMWVGAVKQLLRPAIAACILGAWVYAHVSHNPVMDLTSINNMASVIGFYLFGDRTLFYLNRKDKP